MATIGQYVDSENFYRKEILRKFLSFRNYCRRVFYFLEKNIFDSNSFRKIVFNI